MRFRAALAVSLLLATLGLPGAAGASTAPAPDPNDCNVDAGGALQDFWPKNRLKFDRAWQITRGAGILVGVVDSGLNTQFHPQLQHLRTRPGLDVIPFKGFAKTDTKDCYGHGTAVTSILAAQPVNGVDFVGIAPDVTVMPIKQTQKQGDGSGKSETIGDGLEAAVKAGAQVVNISITTPTQTAELESAIRDAARHDVVVVAAAGNDGDNNKNRPAYPAAYATKYPNVIAVSATDRNDAVPDFSAVGNYVTVAAPGVDVPAAAARDKGYLAPSGTSFATPYVAGTAALLRSAYSKMTAAQVRNRIVATADVPPAAVPDAKYGYGIVNPFLAVTSIRNDNPPPTGARTQAPLAARTVPKPPDRHLEHLALASAAILLGLLVIAIAGAAVLRARGRRAPARIA